VAFSNIIVTIKKLITYHYNEVEKNCVTEFLANTLTGGRNGSGCL